MRRIALVLLIVSNTVCAQKNKAWLADYLRPAVFSTTMVMVHDVVNPPAAARYYAYMMLGAYTIIAQNNSAVPGPASFIKTYPAMRLDKSPKEYDYRIAALYCILETGKLMLPSGIRLKDKEDDLIDSLKKHKIPAAIIQNSVLVANSVAAQIVAYAKTDNYGKLSAKLRYTPIKGDAYWYPTPPSYMEAVEPNWRIIRTMVLDSCNEFVPSPLVPFSKDSNSAFYKLAKEVYDTSKVLTTYQSTIANFWDCNPFAVTTSGHMMIGFKKISPGGHWMDITGIAAAKAKLDFDHAVLLHAVVSVTLMDAFISCWDEKYRSSRIRPETYIGRYIDARWQPLLQTPPFPEYTSGHSVISTASAAVLTYFLGDHFSYTDNAEELFDIPERSFESFNEAAAEASISRLYGGIHYRDAVVNGQRQGRLVAEKVISKISKAGIRPL